MKDFIWPSGIKRSTMTVKELRDFLEPYQEDLPVFAQWEGCNGYIQPENFAVEEVRKSEIVMALVIDVNEY